MDYWSQRGKKAILAALQAACESVETDLASEIQQQINDQHALLLEEIDRLKAVAEKVDRLERENHALVEELSQLRQRAPLPSLKDPEPSSTARHSPQPEPVPPWAESSCNHGLLSTAIAPSASDPEEDQDWKEKYTMWRRRFTALREQYDQLRYQTKAYQKSRDSWKLYAESLQAKVQQLQSRMIRNGASGRSSAEPADLETGTKTPTVGPVPRETSAVRRPRSPTPEASQGDTRGMNEGARHAASSPFASRTAGLPGEDETQGESDGADELPAKPSGDHAESKRPVFIKQEPSSDIPVVVSEREVRKRKTRDEDTGGAASLCRVKCEPSSSPFAILGEARVFSPHESIDLDGEGNRIPTPRKQRPAEQRLLEDEDESITANDPEPPRPWDTALGRTGEPDHSLDWPSSPPKGPSKAGGDMHPSAEQAWTRAIADVAEETPGPLYAPASRRTEKEPLQAPAQSRLHSLLNQKPATGTSTPSRLPPIRSSALKRRSWAETITPSKLFGNLDFDLDKENRGSVSERQPKRPRDAPARPAPAAFTSPAAPPRGTAARATASKTVRLRDKPLDQLRPEDFKVNPKMNNGHWFAYDEVVRSRDERAGLAGCTDPKCCGRQWRLMAESELSAGGMAVLERPADVQMVEEYLGSEAYRLAAMTPEERRETWLKAKVQDLADRYGRHRHRFHRRSSPPGYWNPDFPNTQEIEQNKKETEEVERRIVEDRRREAIRGGRWLFRDE
ncbi:hypothetical protein VTJ83DRAFT_4013 [Remersonia thermophila]|uniref:DNA endonuclease activator Ctp1 C-terminal domain-containing protein n=1 Tax=Remersonia thermophila TaxID=72144 RepID=A0ABR4DFP5_9PEZI